MFAPSLEGNQQIQTGIELAVLPVLVLFSAYMFFKGEKAGAQNGFILGIYFIIIGTILDLLITIPLFVKTYDFFKSWSLWAGYLETLVFASIAGYYMEKKK